MRVVTEAAELSQTRVVTAGWEGREQSGRPHRRQPNLSHHLDACTGGADQPGWLGGGRALRNLSMGGCSCMFLHPPLLWTQLLEDPLACTLLHPVRVTEGTHLDPTVQAAMIRDFIFGKNDSHSSTLQIRAHKARAIGPPH